MNISLNIASSSNQSSKQPGKLHQNHGSSQKKRKAEINDFSFNFTKNSNVKPLVAKRRNPQLIAKKLAQTRNESDEQGMFFGNKTKEKNAKTPDSVHIPQVVENTISLSLNTIAGSEEDHLGRLAKIEIKKMNSKQRKEFVMQKRITKFHEHEQLSNPIKKTQFKGRDKSGEPKSQESKEESNYAKPQKTKKMPSLFANNPTVPIVGQRLVKPLNEPVFTGASVNTIGLHDHAVKNLADLLQITELTTVQQRTIPVVLTGRDVLVRSQTGSGKTLAYALPIVQKLQDIRPKLTRDGGIQALIIVPTRELAIQSYELFIKLLKPYTWIVSGYLSGGEKRKAEKARLRKGINILVGTPGRLCDHLLNTESFKLDKVKWLVLDEADRLFELGYEKDVKKIVDILNESGVSGDAEPSGKNPFIKKVIDPSVKSGSTTLQSLLLSATLTASVRQLAGLALKDPMFIDTTDVNDSDILKTNTFTESIDDAVADEKIVIPSTISQSYILVPPKLRLVTLSGLISLESKKAASKILVFLGTEHLVDFHYDLMIEALTRKVLDSDDEDEDGDGEDDSEDDGEKPILSGVRFFKLHGSLTQVERSAVFKAFKEVKSGVLLTTDVAARGIDVPMVDLVVQFSPPQKISDYVHRVGRTARAGRTGRALLFLAPNETEFIRILEDKKIRISQDDSGKLLKGIVEDQSISGTLEESASELQRKFEALIADDKEMYDRACKAFVSWVRFVAAFPKDLRDIFNIKQAHMGHYAKSLGLREPPKSFAKLHSAPRPAMPTNRLTYTDRPYRRTFDAKGRKVTAAAVGQKRSNTNNLNFNKFISKSISLSTSEFGSGLPPLKKKKK